MNNVKLKWMEFGRVQATIVDENGIQVDQFIGDNPDDVLSRARREYKIHQVLNHENYTHPNLSHFADIDALVNEIEQETEQLRQMGMLAPFVEGTPIGTIPLEHRADLKKRRKKNGRNRRA